MAKQDGAAAAIASGPCEFVREHRAHFEIERETIDGASGRTLAGFDVRLFALHEKIAHAVPGCPVCSRVAAALRGIGNTAFLTNPVDADVHIAPFEPVLYDSKQVPGSDEVMLTVQLWPHWSSCGVERCLKEVRGRMRGLGVREQ